MKKRAGLVLAVVVVQAVLVGGYVIAEYLRGADAEGVLGTAAPERVDAALPTLTVHARDGSRVALPRPQRPTLLHFWATWCLPCREELPALLALPDKVPLEVVAVALDREWAPVTDFLGEVPGTNVVLAEGRQVEGAFGVRTLPVTFLVEPTGRISLRFDGARDWSDRAFRETWLGQLEGD